MARRSRAERRYRRRVKRRGGALRYRTKRVGPGKWIRIAVVRRRGRRGGTTVGSPVRRRRRRRR